MNKCYYNKAKDIVKALQNTLPDCGDAYHELWNAWTTHIDPYNMAMYFEKYNFTFIGYFYVKNPKGLYNIGLIAEDKDGNRFWSHWREDWYENWQKYFPELYEED